MNKDMKAKNKLAKVPKYQYGGDINDPAYLDYLARTGQSIDNIKYKNDTYNNNVKSNNQGYAENKAIAGVATGVATAFNPIAGIVVGGISSALLNNQKSKNDEYVKNNDRLVSRDLDKEQKFYKDDSELSSLKGNAGVEYFGKHGINNLDSKVKGVTDGYLEPIAKGVDLIKGKTHKQGGIGFHNANGKKIAEVQNQEVKLKSDITGKESVLSNDVFIRPGVSIADEATRLGKVQGKLEKMENPDRNGSLTRVKTRLANLPNIQESIKGETTNTMYGEDGIDDLNKPKSYNPYEKSLKSFDVTNSSNSFYNDIDSSNINPPSSLLDNGQNMGYQKSKPYNPYEKSLKLFDVNGNSDIINQNDRFSKLDISDTGTYDTKTNSPLPANQVKKSMDYGTILDTAFNSARFIDNINNSNLIDNTPTISKPNLQRPAKLETNYSVDQNINENRNAYNDYAKNVDANNTSGGTANANKAVAYAARLKANNQIYSQKTNIETGLRNQNALNNQEVTGRNLAALDRFELQKYDRNLMIQGRKSDNVANVVEDIGHIGTERNLKILDDSKISHIGQLYDSNDASASALYPEYRDAAHTDAQLGRLKIQMSKSPKGRKDWNSDSRNQNNLIPV